MASDETCRHRPPGLTPEEDAVGGEGEDDEIDDTLPADLWFRWPRPTAGSAPGGHRILSDR
jgi:hypothetical protein